MMTTVAALFCTLPLAQGTGVGSELRRPPGIAIVGGLLVSQLLTLYTTPVVYLYLDRLRLRVARMRPGASEVTLIPNRSVRSNQVNSDRFRSEGTIIRHSHPRADFERSVETFEEPKGKIWWR